MKHLVHGISVFSFMFILQGDLKIKRDFFHLTVFISNTPYKYAPFSTLFRRNIIHIAKFSAPVQFWPWNPPSLLYNGFRVFPGVKSVGRGVDHPRASSTKVKESVQIHIYSPYGSSCTVIG